MIADTGNIIEMIFNIGIGMVSGNWILLGILIFLCIAIVLVWGKAKASTVVMVGVSMAFIFALLAVSWAFMWIVWIAIIGALFVLFNGIRKWITGQ